MKTGLTKKQKITELYFNENDAITEVYTHNTALKKRLIAYGNYASRLTMTVKAAYDLRLPKSGSVFV